jgi:hypothetical protein
LTVGQQQSHAQAIDARIVADGSQVPDALTDKRADQVLRHPAQTESTNHNGGSGEHVLDRLFRARNNFVHSKRFYRNSTALEIPKIQPAVLDGYRRARGGFAGSAGLLLRN